jgi:UDP-glucose 4-epimerase
MRRAIVLGASGFVGAALARRLAVDGVEVHGFSSRTLDLGGPLGALDVLAGADTDLVHLSALTPDRGATTLAGFTSNIAFCTNVAAWLETHPVRSCTFVSSDVVYDSRAEGALVESSPLARLDDRGPRTNLYAAAKIAGERVLGAVSDARLIPYLVIRPCAVFGPNDTHGAYGPNTFVRSIIDSGRVRLFGEGEELRDHLFVEDLAAAVAELVARRTTGVMNVASGTPRSFASIVEALREIADRPFEVDRVTRQIPLVHRTFDTSALRAVLPDLRLHAFEDALRATYVAARR